MEIATLGAVSSFIRPRSIHRRSSISASPLRFFFSSPGFPRYQAAVTRVGDVDEFYSGAPVVRHTQISHTRWRPSRPASVPVDCSGPHVGSPPKAEHQSFPFSSSFRNQRDSVSSFFSLATPGALCRFLSRLATGSSTTRPLSLFLCRSSSRARHRL